MLYFFRKKIVTHASCWKSVVCRIVTFDKKMLHGKSYKKSAENQQINPHL